MALPPTKWSDFQVAEAIGAGTTARVYDAVHRPTGTPVAIKILQADQDAPPVEGAEMRERFAREALLLAGLDSRHVGKITGFGFEKGRPFLVLEKLTGETLDAKLRRDGPVPAPTALRWIEQLLLGVRDCHDAQIIHRDIKPSNIFVHTTPFESIVKLIDFGVARLREITNDAGALTGKNHLIGSMGYMAPEQFSDPQRVGYPADLYAVGVVIFRTFTGRLPFVSRSIDAVIKMKTDRVPPLVSAMPNMPRSARLDAYVAKAMQRDPALRFKTAREMLEQWWNVMATFDEDAATDIMRSGRDAATAGTPHRPAPSTRKSGSMDVGVVEPAPNTLPSAAPETIAAPTTQPDDPSADIPTRNDPNLRKLVERELAIHRRKGAR